MTEDGKGLGDAFEQTPADRLQAGDVIMIEGSAGNVIAEFPAEGPRGDYAHVCNRGVECGNRWKDQTECAQCPLCGSSATSEKI